MKKNKVYFSAFLVIVYVISLLSFGVQPVKAEIAPGIKVPTFAQLQSNPKLPDPFMFLDGTRMTTREQWPQRREEISALAQTFEFGIKPPKPESVTGSFSDNKINVTCKNGGKTINFSCSIEYPSTGKAPYPAIIGLNYGMGGSGSTLNNTEIKKLGVAIINFPSDLLGQHTNSGSRGKGLFFDMYGSTYDAGAMMAWAWGVSRLIDALETTPAANIDPKHLGVTGGSRWGKGALTCGVFDERIALTIPQESGNGGASGWRTADAMKSSGANVQTLSQIIGENCWFAKSLNQFSGNTNKLPFDHHEIEALCAPRGLLVIENTSMEWLGNLSCYETAQAARMVYEALGVPDNMGFSQIGGHDHCSYPNSQIPELQAFIKRFLLEDKSVSTKYNRTDGNFTFNKTKWIDWTVPALTGTVPWPDGSGNASPSPTNTTKPTPTNTQKPSPTPVITPDITGDGVVNIADAMVLATAFNSRVGDSRYNEKCDLDRNGAVNISDVLILAEKFNKMV
jgi:hypothetical protein